MASIDPTAFCPSDHAELVEHLYDQDFDRDSNTIEVFVGRLRKKLGVNLIQTMRGLGYKLDEGAADTDVNAAH